jgi:hypothetical protein
MSLFTFISSGIRRSLGPSSGDPGTVYYVNSINGNDSNNGLSDTLAVKTWDKLNEIVTANSRVMISCGSEFRDDSLPDPADIPITPGHTASLFVAGGLATCINGYENKWQGVEIDIYGMGDYPLFDLRKTLDNASIIKEGGYTNVYRIDFDRVQQDNYGNEYGGMWEDESIFKEHVVNAGGVNPAYDNASETAAITAVDGEAGTFYFKRTTGIQAASYYFHIPNSGDPITNGKTYKVRYFDWFLVRTEGNTTNTSRAGITVKGIKTIGNAMHNGAIWGANITTYDVTVLEFARHGVMIHGFLQGCRVFFGNWLFGGAEYHAFSEYVGERRATIYRNCVAVGWKDNNDKGASIAGFYYHAGAGASYNELIYENCVVINSGTAFQIDSNVKFIKLTNPKVINCKRFLYNITPYTSTRAKIDIENPFIIGNISGTEGSTLMELREVDLTVTNGNIFWNGTNIIKLNTSEFQKIKFYNTMLCLKGTGTFAYFRVYSMVDSPTIILKDCIIPNMDAGQKKLIEVESGVGYDSDKVIIDRCTMGDFSLLGFTNLTTMKATYPGVDDVNSAIAIASILTDNPQYGKFNIDLSKLTDEYQGNIYAGETRGLQSHYDIKYNE